MEIHDGGVMAMVADGMGGQAAGEVASHKAVLLLEEKLMGFQAPSLKEEKEILGKIFWEVNQHIIELGKVGTPHYNMGTTVVLALKPQDRDYFLVAHLGDSRAYEWSNGNLVSVTADHTVTEFLLKQGIIKADQVANHPFRNRLLKYLGSKDIQDGPDITTIPLKAGQRLLLCSDGLTGGLGEKELEDGLAGKPLDGLAAKLCQAAYNAGSADNISCVILEVLASEPNHD